MIAQRAVARHRVFEQLSRPLILAHCACLHRRVDEQLRLTLILSQGTAQCHALLKELRGTRVIVLIGGQPSCHIQRLQACGTGNDVGHIMLQRQQFLQPDTTLTEVAATAPEPPERRGKLKPDRAIATIAGPLQCRAQVVVLAIELREPRVDGRSAPGPAYSENL